jgi:hypothetical protein
VAATYETFQPNPRQKSAAAIAGTLSTHTSPLTERPMSSRPPDNETVRPIRSTTSPTTITSAYMPTTVTPMIGRTLWS